ncbi:MAG TPA: molybdate ABC transporter substrate-binding protein [Acidimicrobiia bacterium]|nr:molybdate ABC transporter substrate-binding protein [Acidimicrobiia bacterium]
MRKLLAVLTLSALALAFTACGGDDDDNDTAAGDTTSGPTGSITVFGAASLTEAFTTLGEDFEAEHPDTKVEFNFAASSELVTQIQNAAPADVFASADASNMTKLTDASLTAGQPEVFAHNQLAIAVEPGNPKGITALADLSNPDITLVLCAPEVPCGKYADQALQQAGVTVNPVSREASVKATLTKVELGEADAAIVYVTDVTSSGKVEGIDIPDDQNVVATLPITTLKDAGNADLAAEWVDYVLSPAAQKVLQDDYGFLAP